MNNKFNSKKYFQFIYLPHKSTLPSYIHKKKKKKLSTYKNIKIIFINFPNDILS